MKKVLLFAVIAMFLMVPMSFAKTAISDSDLDAVTAQEGVVIMLDNVAVSNVSIGVQSWGDKDGFGTTYNATPGWVGAIITMSGTVVSLSGEMTIDVGTNAAASPAGAIRIGLPTVQIGSASDHLNITQEIRLGGEKTLSVASTYGVLGTAYMGDVRATVTGAVLITNH